MSTPEKCPNCKGSFQGEPIPEEYRKHYGDKTHYSLVIGIYDDNLDRTVEWKCPFCDYTWKRE